MTRLFRSKSCGLVGLTEFNPVPPAQGPLFHNRQNKNEEEDEEEEDDDYEVEDGYGSDVSVEPISRTRFKSRSLSPRSRSGAENSTDNNKGAGQQHQCHQFPILDILATALRKSLVTCSVETSEDISSMDISWPTQVRHVSHVTFDRFNGFLGLPTELEPELPKRVPSASASVFGVSAKSMQCSYDDRGNSVPTILLMMQKRLYSEGGLRAEGIFRITAENSQEEYVRDQLNRGVVLRGIDVHCLAGLIKAWLRELPTGVLDSLTPEQVTLCNTEDDCTQLVNLLPPMEGALLDWSVNLMADVVQHEQFNKMNARNIAMVFAPNMTQLADPLTALIHAVQVMNFLKTLILKTLREREESATEARKLSSCSDSPIHNDDPISSMSNGKESRERTSDPCAANRPSNINFLRTATLDRLESNSMEKLWSFHRKSDGEEEEEEEEEEEDEDEFEYESGSDTPTRFEMGALENGCRSGYDTGDWLSLRKGVRRLCRHPVFQLNKPAKKTRSLGIINSRG